jgi:hypothetical protein
MKTVLYVDLMADHLKFAVTLSRKNDEQPLIRGTVKTFNDLRQLELFIQPDEMLIYPGFKSDEVKAFSERHDIPFPATREQQARIEHFTESTPQA